LYDGRKGLPSRRELFAKVIPELRFLPDKYIHNPWKASPSVLELAGVRLDHIYPFPIVDHKKALALALDAFKIIKHF
jgi:deoxyribodipyrimidine photo-lyase